ncbi:MAG: hypothetical protein GXP62_12420 [Oligoflexia bacterium]|nr:hypothetical protein [Oligoflexia bacterium]
MREYDFTLILDGPRSLTTELENALFRAGCDDALLGFRDGIAFLDFTRRATSLEDALVAAVRQVRKAAPDLAVLRVEPDELVTASDIASRTGRTRESVRLLVSGQRGPGGFPAPVRGTRSRARLWRWSEVVTWLAAYDPTGVAPEDISDSQVIAAINAALLLQRSAPDQPGHLLERLSA